MQIRKMTEADIDAVVDIIDAHDDDDAEDARHDFETHGGSDQWVAEFDGRVVGTSGFRRVPETDGTAWISWTYVDAEKCGQGIGRTLFQHVLDEIAGAGGRKIFVKISNYQDDEGDSPYAAAAKMYEAFGFGVDLINKDFYDVGEDQYIYSKSLTPDDGEDVLKEDEKPAIQFVDIFEIGETDGAYSFSWEVAGRSLFRRNSFTANDLMIGLRAVKEQEGRAVFLTFPSNLPLIHSPLAEAGFRFVGQLTDYYERGVHELHYVHDLEGV